MKTLLISLFIFSSLFLNAQQPVGKLFIHTQKTISAKKDVLGVVNYYGSTPTYSVFDSTALTDMMIYDDNIYIANNNVWIYDIQSQQKVDSVINTNARQIASWKDKLIVTSTSKPYFRVYDISNSYSFEFELDTTKIKYTPSDIIVSGDWAIMTIDTNIIIVDMLLQDTLAIVGIDAPLKWAGYSSFLIEAQNEVYVDLEYWTGAPRFSFVKLDKVNLKTDSAFHVEIGMNVYKPQAVNERIYLTEYPSYYDTKTDSLYLLGGYSPYTIESDSSSGCIFVYDDMNKNILCYDDTNIINTFTVPNYLMMALWYDESTTSLSSYELGGECEIFPVPARDFLNIDFPGSIDQIKIYNVGGELVMSKQAGTKRVIDISDLSPGLYFIAIINNNNDHIAKFIKN